MFHKDLGDGFVIKEIDSREIRRIQNLHFANIYANRISDPSSWVLSEENKEKIQVRQHAEQRRELMLGIYKDSEAIGWHRGFSTDPETFYMQNTAVLKEHRGLGLYTRVLEVVFELVKAEGFQVITSKHHPNNPAVLVPKLKKGIIISGCEFHEKFRFLIELKFFFDEQRRKDYSKSLGLEL